MTTTIKTTADDIFTVSESKVWRGSGNARKVIPNRKAIVVDYQVKDDETGEMVNTDKCVNIVSGNYEVHQPSEIFQTFSNVASEFGMTISNVMQNPHNGGLLINANYSTVNILGDDHKVNIILYTSHCGRYKTFLSLDLLRLACMNQVPVLYRAKDRFIFSEKHYRRALDMDVMAQAIAGIPTSMDAYVNNAEVLMGKKFSYGDFVEFYKAKNKLDEKSKQYDTKIQNLEAIYYGADGQETLEDNTAYKAFNAITYMNTHVQRKGKFSTENVIRERGTDSIKTMELLLAA